MKPRKVSRRVSEMQNDKSQIYFDVSTNLLYTIDHSLIRPSNQNCRTFESRVRGQAWGHLETLI